MTIPANIAERLGHYSKLVEYHTEKCTLESATAMLESLGCLESSIAELAAERDAFSAAFRLLDRTTSNSNHLVPRCSVCLL